jgi:hypothetical protein
MTTTVTVTTPVAIASITERVVELTVELPRGYAVIYVHHREVMVDGNEAWGMPTTETRISVAAERWCDGMDDDGEGIALTTVEEIAILLGCQPGEVPSTLREEYWNHALPGDE